MDRIAAPEAAFASVTPEEAQEEPAQSAGFLERLRTKIEKHRRYGVPLSCYVRGWWLGRKFDKVSDGTLLVMPGAPFPIVSNLGGRIEVEGCTIYHGVRFDVHRGGLLQVGKGTVIGSYTTLCSGSHLKIGRWVQIAHFVHIYDTDCHGVGDRPVGRKPVTIGDHAWICNAAIILKGVTIGEGAIVAPGAIVTKDVPPYTMVAGPTAQVIRELEPGKHAQSFER